LKWEIQTGSIHLSEFDPYYQYSLTNFMVKNGLFSPYMRQPNGDPQWIDRQRWYPEGINMGMSLPSLPMTAAFFYDIISVLGVNVGLMEFCALFPAIMGTLACLIIYFVGKDVGGKSVGMFAALFLALSPSYIQRTSVGFFDDETIGIVALVLFVFMFLRAIEEERPVSSGVKYSIGSGLTLAYFVAGWGAAVYPIGLTVLFVFVMILLKRYTWRLLLSYSITFGLGLFITVNVPGISLAYLTTSPIILVAGMFVLLLLSELLRNLTSVKSKMLFAVLFLVSLVSAFTILWSLGYTGLIGGKFMSVIDPIMRAASPLTESVAEHRITAWGPMYFEFGAGIIFFIASFFFILRKPNNRNVFLLIFGLTSLYFAGSMVRLLVLIAPAFALLAAVGIMGILKPFNTLLKEPLKIFTKKKYSLQHVGKEFSGVGIFLIFLMLMTNFVVSPQSGGMPKVYTQAYTPVTITAAGLSITPNEPITAWMDALEWMKSNLSPTTAVCSWWDYGYWLTILGNVTSLADNATINGTQIALIGRVYTSTEVQAVRILKEQFNGPHGPPAYILVFITFASTGQDYSVGGDEGKWMWMAKIANSSDIARNLYADEWGEWTYKEWTDSTGQYNTFGNATASPFVWNDVGQNTTIYKLMAYAKSAVSGQSAPQLTYFKNPHFFGGPIGTLGTTSSGTTVYLDALVCLYEVDYEKCG
jgi:dolichyl-diphosphooligosaccharide--protein glycosyltransferase